MCLCVSNIDLFLCGYVCLEEMDIGQRGEFLKMFNEHISFKLFDWLHWGNLLPAESRAEVVGININITCYDLPVTDWKYIYIILNTSFTDFLYWGSTTVCTVEWLRMTRIARNPKGQPIILKIWLSEVGGGREVINSCPYVQSIIFLFDSLQQSYLKIARRSREWTSDF